MTMQFLLLYFEHFFNDSFSIIEKGNNIYSLLLDNYILKVVTEWDGEIEYLSLYHNADLIGNKLYPDGQYLRETIYYMIENPE